MRHPASRAAPVTRELTVGLVGAGLIAGVHAEAYRRVPGVRLVAVFDRAVKKARQLAERYEARVVLGLDECWLWGVDGVRALQVALAGYRSAATGKVAAATEPLLDS